MAIKSDSLLSEFQNNHQYDNQYMLTDSDAQEKFNKIQLANLEKLLLECN
jgi:hypothetical protein